jgi:hypothetical protein
MRAIDATSCVDIGDVLFVQDGLQPQPEFLELKDGAVNEAILDMVALTGEERDARLAEFVDKHGEGGIKQSKRSLRQHEISGQALKLLHEERGIDPVSGSSIEIVDLGIVPDDYDEALNALLGTALERHIEVVELVGECLWVYANADPAVSRTQALQHFEAFLEAKVPRAYRAGRPARLEPTDRGRL